MSNESITPEEFRREWMRGNPNTIHIPSEHEASLMKQYAEFRTINLQKRIKELEDGKSAELNNFLEWHRSKQAVNTFNDCKNTYIIEEYFKSSK